MTRDELPIGDYFNHRNAAYIAQLERDLAAARADCAQFCGDNERLIKAAGAETVAGALEAIAMTRAQLKAANAYARSDAEKLDAARAEAARLRERSCRTCEHYVSNIKLNGVAQPDACGHLSVIGSDFWVICEEVGWGCNAWSALEGEP